MPPINFQVIEGKEEFFLIFKNIIDIWISGNSYENPSRADGTQRNSQIVNNRSYVYERAPIVWIVNNNLNTKNMNIQNISLNCILFCTF